MTTYTIPAELLQELISNCMASIAEDGISDARRVYRTELHHRANLAMRNLQPNMQWQDLTVQEQAEATSKFGHVWSIDMIGIADAISAKLQEKNGHLHQAQRIEETEAKLRIAQMSTVEKCAEIYTLRKAAQAVIDRWDAPLWKDAPATAEYINKLRKALK